MADRVLRQAGVVAREAAASPLIRTLAPGTVELIALWNAYVEHCTDVWEEVME
jgi:hypothetical protein